MPMAVITRMMKEAVPQFSFFLPAVGPPRFFFPFADVSQINIPPPWFHYFHILFFLYFRIWSGFVVSLRKVWQIDYRLRRRPLGFLSPFLRGDSNDEGIKY